jgi:protein TonB
VAVLAIDPTGRRLSGIALSVRADRWRWAVAFSLALAAHAAVLVALMREPQELLAGGGGQLIDAISVTIVSSDVLESVEPEKVQPSAAAVAASVEANEGTPDSVPAAAAERRDEKAEKEQPDKEHKQPQEEPVRAAEAIFEVPKEAQRKREQQSPAAPAAGGAAARALSDTPAKTSAPAAASAGVVREYARYVSLTLSRTKPRGAGRLGTVRIKFTIAADGSLASAEITKTSGNDRLDASALEAVRHAKFPVPPLGMSLAQLTYEVPYHFR